MRNTVLAAVALFAVCGCQSRQPASHIELSTEYTALPDPAVLLDAVGSPLKLVDGLDSANLVVYQLPDISLPSGRVIASDAFVMGNKPFARSVPRGRFPLLLGVAKFDNDERVAFAMIQFSTAPIHKWELALVEGEDRAKLGPDQLSGYGVDSGTACLADAGAYQVVSDAFDPDMRFFDRVEKEMQNLPAQNWVSLECGQGSAAFFSSGFGDGFYASYFALDDKDNVVALMTDFNIYHWPKRP